ALHQVTLAPLVWPLAGDLKTQAFAGAHELAGRKSTGIGDHPLAPGSEGACEGSGDEIRIGALVEHVRSDDDVETTEIAWQRSPVQKLRAQPRTCIAPRVRLREAEGVLVVVRGQDFPAGAECGCRDEPQAAAEFQQSPS